MSLNTKCDHNLALYLNKNNILHGITSLNEYDMIQRNIQDIKRSINIKHAEATEQSMINDLGGCMGGFCN